jgi:hypothetical protein
MINDSDGKTRMKRPLGRPRHMWKDIIKIDLREMEWGCMDLTGLDVDRDQWRAFVNTEMNQLFFTDLLDRIYNKCTCSVSTGSYMSYASWCK